MKSFEDYLQHAAPVEHFTAAERAKLRASLSEYMAWKPVRVAATPVPYPTLLGAFMHQLRRPALASLAVMLALVLSSGGVAYAAEGALPGGTLYPVKVAVVEPVETVLAFSASAKAAVYQAHAEERLAEAAALAKDGTLATTTAASLAANFNANVALASASEASSSDPATSAVVATNFAARLAGYETVLAQLDAKKHATSTAPLRADVSAHIALLTASAHPSAPHSAASLRAAATTNATTTSYALQLQEAANASLRASADLIGASRGSLSSSTSASAEGELGTAEASEEHGRDLLAAHDDAGASAAFSQSLSVSAKLSVLTHAAATLHIDPFNATASTTNSSATTTPVSASSTPPFPHPFDY